MSSAPSSPGAEGGIPRGAIVGGAVLIVGTIALAALARPPRPVAEPPEAARLLTFVDRSDGAVVVLDATRADTVAVVNPGTGGFVRGALRGLSRERQRRDQARTAPFELALLTGDRLVLTDPTTGHRIDLAAFGPTNEGVFRSFLHPTGRSR